MKDESSAREDDEIRSSNPSKIRARLCPLHSRHETTQQRPPSSVDETHPHTSAPLCRSFNEKSILRSHLADSRGCLCNATRSEGIKAKKLRKKGRRKKKKGKEKRNVREDKDGMNTHTYIDIHDTHRHTQHTHIHTHTHKFRGRTVVIVCRTYCQILTMIVTCNNQRNSTNRVGGTCATGRIPKRNYVEIGKARRGARGHAAPPRGCQRYFSTCTKCDKTDELTMSNLTVIYI